MTTKTKNKRFNGMTRAQKRVAIAKDVLKRIAQRQFNMEAGMWLELAPKRSQAPGETREQYVQALVTEHTPCRCCAVGGACASIVGLFDNEQLASPHYNSPAIDDYSEALRIMAKFFSQKQIELIEGAFERRERVSFLDNRFPDKERDALAAFNDFDESNEDTAKRIFTNIIKNKGTFKP